MTSREKKNEKWEEGYWKKWHKKYSLEKSKDPDFKIKLPKIEGPLNPIFASMKFIEEVAEIDISNGVYEDNLHLALSELPKVVRKARRIFKTFEREK